MTPKTGPAYVAYVTPNRYQPRCHAHGDTIWQGPETGVLDGALLNARVHNDDNHLPAPHTQLDLGMDAA